MSEVLQIDRETLRKLQLKELESLEYFDSFCKENELRYYLLGGCVIGALRHGGFIPWDDDIDIIMPRRDYDRFCKLAPKRLSDEYFLQTYFTDKNYPNPFAKIRLRGTEFVESITERSKMKGGIYIDVFPFDNFPR